jgi:hypothetical protein
LISPLTGWSSGISFSGGIPIGLRPTRMITAVGGISGLRALRIAWIPHFRNKSTKAQLASQERVSGGSLGLVLSLPHSMAIPSLIVSGSIAKPLLKVFHPASLRAKSIYSAVRRASPSLTARISYTTSAYGFRARVGRAFALAQYSCDESLQSPSWP